jgi:hypothetical protein
VEEWRLLEVPNPARPPHARPLALPWRTLLFPYEVTPMTKGEIYRKRAKALSKRLGNRQTQTTTPVGRKQKALTDMADNEDWLDGKIKAKA